jgi:hypothetical protein
LLRAHVLRRPDPLPELGEHRPFRQTLRRRLGDAEVDDLGYGPPVLERDEHVRRLQVAVDDPLLVGVLHPLAHLDEQLEALAGAQAVRVAVLVEGDPRHVLHHEVGETPLRGPRVEDAGDVGVAHEGQGLPLGLEPGQDLFRGQPPLDELQRHPPLDRLALLGLVDDTHAALSELPERPVVADRLRNLVGGGGEAERRRAVGVVESQELLHLRSKLGVLSAGVVEGVDPLLGRPLAGVEEDLPGPREALFGHVPGSRASSRRSQARAWVQ